MTLQLPTVNDWTTLQQVLDQIARRFPLGDQDIGQGVLKLFTAADLKLKTGALSNVFAGTVGANSDATWTPVAADLGLTTLSLALLTLVPVSVEDCLVRSNNLFAPSITIRSGATVQQYGGHYLALGT